LAGRITLMDPNPYEAPREATHKAGKALVRRVAFLAAGAIALAITWGLLGWLAFSLITSQFGRRAAPPALARLSGVPVLGGRRMLA
jgi:hypothetical protein